MRADIAAAELHQPRKTLTLASPGIPREETSQHRTTIRFLSERRVVRRVTLKYAYDMSNVQEP
jgi:hypothetical protein